MSATLKKLTSVIQAASSNHSATVIFIHGLGDSGAGWAPVGQELGRYLPHVKFIFPNAPDMPVTLNYGMQMPSWYDIKSLGNIDQEQDEAGMLKSRQQLMQIVREEIDEHGIPANRIVIGGFSQGCVMGLLTGLTSEYKFAGIVSLSGYMPLHNKIMSMASDSNRKTPIFWGHGDVDQVVRYQFGERSVEMLKQNKYNVKFNTYRNMGHSSCPQEIRDLLGFLKETIPPISQ
ncbi:hypothetical protein BGZ80_009026 [Entomortierella chlamydospora]|uniref:Acyl-protein thioesterase 1 n=1 Tax=Entomortierella chlamydospora TaxID=101097 RepID=A0A9P6MWZ3_9FUNG|nr:hypothetical protein BGZ79_010771 [Entomortierella chlamydospora]KAG0016692.1 hypothetical protein BGZ80_009026 [Entomortierella chlamydospora]